jgi:hypothetical protein
VYSVSAFQVIGFCPIVTRAVKPVPNATTSRPGANASTAAIADAVTMGCRMLGTATPVPRPMRSVASAIRAKEIQISVYSEGESNNQARSYPSFSAIWLCSTDWSPGGHAKEIFGRDMSRTLS